MLNKDSQSSKRRDVKRSDGLHRITITLERSPPGKRSKGGQAERRARGDQVISSEPCSWGTGQPL